MLKVENRESAHLRSRVKDESVVPNVVSFTGLFECLTPISKAQKDPDTGLYAPILIRDTDSLIANFGDPRIDPEKYVDLYSIMNIVGNGTSCYVAKVPSGKEGEYEFAFVPEKEFSGRLIDVDEKDDIVRTIIQGGEVTSSSLKLLEQQSNNSSILLQSKPLNNKYTIKSLGKASAKYAKAEIDDDVYVQAKTTDSANNGIIVTFTTDSELSPEKIIISYKINSEAQPVTIKEESIGSGDSATFSIADINDSLHELGAPIKFIGSDSSLVIVSTDLPPNLELSGGGITSDGDLDKDNYEFTYENIGEQFRLHVTLKLDDESLPDPPKYVFINECELDADWEPECGNSYSATIPLDSTDNSNVYRHPFKREYTVIEIKDNADAVVDHDKYTYKYENGYLVVTFDEPVTVPKITKKAPRILSIIGSSSMTESLRFDCKLLQVKPYSLKAYYLVVTLKSGNNILGTASIKLDSNTTNQTIVNNLNSVLGTYVRFELAVDTTENRAACELKEGGKNSIAAAMLFRWATADGKRANLVNKETPLSSPAMLEKAEFAVSLQNYIDTVNQYADRRYSGCLMADFTAPVNKRVSATDDSTLEFIDSSEEDRNKVHNLTAEERRALHYYIKDVACRRKDCTAVLSVPLCKNEDEDSTIMTMDEACDWVASQKDFTDLWEYGESNTTDYSKQSFYLEMYYTWLNMTCTKIENGLAKSVQVRIAPSNVVCNNILTSYRERGVQYPVAGDQYGTLSDQCTIIKNPKSKEERDQLVQYRINPIWDTGTRGIQIYGNETLNAGYTDLNAAHIARTLVYIRNRIDEYTETLKFLINSQILWDTWKNYVTSYILEPLKAENALSSYSVAMGSDTTSAAEIANRQINGVVYLTFYQSAEIFDLTFVVYSSATAFE